jgi:hypothetical protein
MIFSSFLFSCSKDMDDSGEPYPDSFTTEGGDATSGDEGGQGDETYEGLITAGEWNDLDNWDFWGDLFQNQQFDQMRSYWGFYTDKRISIQLTNNELALINAKVEIFNEDQLIWSTRTDNFGKAELWVGLYDTQTSIPAENLTIKIDDIELNTELHYYRDNGVNTINFSQSATNLNQVDLCFIVDATGSMGDEIEFLKDDLQSVIQNVMNQDASLNIHTSTVFYRDNQDEYLVKKSDFTSELIETINFIDKQSADGGGDYPEAVHTGLSTAINDLQWSTNARTRLAFLILDAPPHHEDNIVEEIRETTRMYAEKGIKIIPVTASGIDKETEFLMRFLSISTNGTYVFITNHSGIGGDHIEPSIGQYDVEILNELLTRLIVKYSE